jgi:hypothetical protein
MVSTWAHQQCVVVLPGWYRGWIWGDQRLSRPRCVRAHVGLTLTWVATASFSEGVFGRDADTSRIHHGGVTPDCKIHHHQSPSARVPTRVRRSQAVEQSGRTALITKPRKP